MTSKFAHKFFLLLFALTAFNSFCTESTKRFGCHNLSSVDKITNMEISNNELLRNLKQCMRDTGTYTEKNLETAKKLQSDFESAEKICDSNMFLGNLLSIGLWGSVIIGLGVAPAAFMGKSTESGRCDDEHRKEQAACALVATGSFMLAYLFEKLGDAQASSINKKRKHKESIAICIKQFTDRLQEKNK